ncbi:MAG: pseudouridine synthase [Bacteroidota bacterium]
MENPSTSLNKYVSSTGICSRREADAWIEAGRLAINGMQAKKGNRVFEGDVVTLDGEPLKAKPESIYIKYHKPPGITCTTDRSDKTNIVDQIKIKERIFPIGRLDKSSTGLILLTNDGGIVNQLLRKENQHEKEYVVKVNRPISKRFLQRMSKPIPMLGTKTEPAKIEQIKPKLFKIILTQGLNRQIRRMVEFCGYKVVTLKRIRFMHIKVDDLEVGQWRYLTQEELEGFKTSVR